MSELEKAAATSASRRALFGGLAGGVAVGLVGVAPASAQTEAPGATASDWPGTMKGRHHQVVDAYESNHGSPLAFAYNFVATNPPGTATGVVVLRHAAFPLALDSTMWKKYQIGEALKIIDPETKAPATKNPFLHPKPGVLPLDAMAIDRLLADGVIFGGCNMALLFLSQMMSAKAGVTARDAAEEWAANVVAGITILPSGVWGLNRAQEAGCSYCTGGG